jgi:hypothetical protein
MTISCVNSFRKKRFFIVFFLGYRELSFVFCIRYPNDFLLSKNRVPGIFFENHLLWKQSGQFLPTGIASGDSLQ